MTKHEYGMSRFIILDALSTHGKLTVKQIMEITGYSYATVNKIIKKLLEENRIVKRVIKAGVYVEPVKQGRKYAYEIRIKKRPESQIPEWAGSL